MKKKHTVFIVIAIIVIIGVAIALKISSDFNKETKIKSDIKEVINVFDTKNINQEKINKVLNRRVIKKGQYKKVEESIKDYYKDLYDDFNNLIFLLDDDNFSNYLTSKNLKDDRPSFLKSKNNLQNSKAQITENYNEFITQLTDETTKLTYIIDKDLDKYYIDFYLSLTNEINKEELKKEIENMTNSAQEKIIIYNEALDFLIANKGHWDIKNEVIMFDKTEYYEEYINITEKLNTIKTEANES